MALLPSRAEQEVIYLACGFIPRDDQWEPMTSQARIVVTGGGERGGKSAEEGNFIAPFVALNQDELVWIVGPDYEQAQPEFIYARAAIEKLALLAASPSQPKEGSWELKTKTHCVVKTRTSEEAVKLAGKAPGLILMVEAGQQSQDVLEQLAGRTAEKRSQLRVSGTFEKAAAYYDSLWRRGQEYPNAEDIQSFALAAWNNTVIFPGGRNDPEILRQEALLGPRTFMRRFGGRPPPLEGQVYSDYNPGTHLCDSFEIPQWWNRYRIIDVGISETHPMCCEYIAVDEKRNVWCYDEFWATNMTIEGASRIIKEKSGRGTGKDRIEDKFNINLIDPAAFSRSPIKGRTAASEFASFGIHCHPANSRDTARISRVMQMFRDDRIHIFRDKCPNLIRTIPLQVWDTKVGKEKRDPRIEDDPVDCLEYFATFFQAPVKPVSANKTPAEREAERFWADLRRMRGQAANENANTWREARI